MSYVKVTNIETMWIGFMTREEFDLIYGKAEGQEMIQGYHPCYQVDPNWKEKPELCQEEIETGFKLDTFTPLPT